MNTTKKYLPFYIKHMESGLLPSSGLCWCLDGIDIMGPVGGRGGFWGFNGDCIYYEDLAPMADRLGITEFDIRHRFTPLRQTVVLFLAAMNNEL